jgi:hypothetical protein
MRSRDKAWETSRPGREVIEGPMLGNYLIPPHKGHRRLGDMSRPGRRWDVKSHEAAKSLFAPGVVRRRSKTFETVRLRTHGVRELLESPSWVETLLTESGLV